MSFLNIQEMKKQIEEMEVQMRLAEEEETRRFSMENVSQSNTNGMDVNEMLNLIRTEQSKMSLEVEQVLNEKALPLEVRMDLFQAIMEQIDNLQSENRSGKIGSTLEAVQKLDETVDELVSQHCCSNGNNHTTASKTLHQPNLKLEEDIIHSLLASISDIKGSWHLSTQKILQKLQPKTVTFQNTEETPKKPSKLTEDDATRSERAKLIHTAKQQWEHLCRLKESESVLESIIYTNDKNVWLAKRIKLVNGKIQTDCSDKQWDADDFIQELENYPWRLFTDEEYEVECWCCNTIMSVKENLQYDGVTVYCGGECDSRTILAKTKPGYCWVQCNCSHYFQFLEGEEPTECEFCESPYFQEGGDYSIMIPRRKELIMRV